MSKFMRTSADADPDAELRYTSNIYSYLAIESFPFLVPAHQNKCQIWILPRMYLFFFIQVNAT